LRADLQIHDGCALRLHGEEMKYENGRIEILPKGYDYRFSSSRQPSKKFQVRIDGEWVCSWPRGPIAEYCSEESALQVAKKRLK
jgi:hypothetical protein